MSVRHFFIAATALLAATGSAVAQATFAVDFSWEGTGKCMEPKSPPFTLSNVPEATKTLKFNMVDLDFTAFAHGGGSVAYEGRPQIARGAFVYRGPCPPSGQHHYQWTVDALDASGKVLASARVTKEFPPK